MRQRLNVVARERVRNPTGCELRFVPEGEGTVEVTLSAKGGTTCEFSVPERVRKLDAAETGAFDPRVCRLRFDAWGPVAAHDVPVGATTLFPYRADLVAGDDAERVRDGVDALRVADRALDGSQADEGP